MEKWLRCDQHKITYPEGRECPLCAGKSGPAPVPPEKNREDYLNAALDSIANPPRFSPLPQSVWLSVYCAVISCSGVDRYEATVIADDALNMYKKRFPDV